MKKLKFYIAISLNGKIARTNGDVDWLEAIPNPNKLDYGYLNFYDTIDTTIQGNETYEKVLSFGVPFPYSGKKNYVFTRQQDKLDNEEVTYVKSNHLDFVRKLKQEKGKDIWLIGGGQIATLLFNENLIDDLHLHIMPIIIPDGIDFFAAHPVEKKLHLQSSKNYPTGVVELIYKLQPKFLW